MQKLLKVLIAILFIGYGYNCFSNTYIAVLDVNYIDTTDATSYCGLCEYDSIHYYMLFNSIRRYDTTYTWEVSGYRVGNDTLTYLIYNKNELFLKLGEAGSLCPEFGGFFGLVGPIVSLKDTGYATYMTVKKCIPKAKIQLHNTIYCSGDRIIINDMSTHKPTMYEWYLNKNNSNYTLISIDTNFIKIISDTGYYQLMFIVSNEKGKDTAYTSFYILESPTYTSDTTQNIILNNTTQTELTACATGDQYEWFPKENLSCATCNVTTATVNADAKYYCVVSNINGCSDTCFYNITAPFDIFVPNAFTPNNDGINDIFNVRGVNIEVQSMKIYNRLGNEIYNGNLENGWNGKYNNVTVEDGVYGYQLIYLNKKINKSINKNGNIMIIR